MKVLFFNPTTANKKFVPYEALRGSAFFRRPNYDAMRIAWHLRQHDYRYFDERTEEKPQAKPDLVFVNVALNLSAYSARIVRELWPNHRRIIAFGFFPTLCPDEAQKEYDAIVVGDITTVIQEILHDFQQGNLRPRYELAGNPGFRVDRRIESEPGFTPILSQMKTMMGCTCKGENRDYCFENIMYGDPIQWDINEAVEEVGRIKRKIIFLRDDDFLHDSDYAIAFLERTWKHKKRWIIQTDQLADNNRFLPTLRECGVRIIYLKECWLGYDLAAMIGNRRFQKEKELQIRMIHKNRMIAGVKLRLGFKNESERFYWQLFQFLNSIKADFIQVAVRMPIPGTRTHAQLNKTHGINNDLSAYDQWMPVVRSEHVDPQALYTWMESLRDRFYSWDSIIMRNLAVARNIGLYNAFFFHIIPNLSYRTNFLEKVGYPP